MNSRTPPSESGRAPAAPRSTHAEVEPSAALEPLGGAAAVNGQDVAHIDAAKPSSTAGRTRDWQLWFTAARNGDQKAYECFLRAVIPVVRGIVCARAGGLGGTAQEDVVQEVFLAIHGKRHTWREDEPVEPWLYAITRYKVVDAFRRRGSRVDVPIEDFAEVMPAPGEADPTDGSDFLRVVERLDGRSAEIVLAIVRHGATIRELAARFGISEAATRVRVHRATKRLAQLRKSMIE